MIPYNQLTEEERVSLLEETKLKVKEMLGSKTEQVEEDDFELPSKTCDNFHNCDCCQ
jgi:hypothetical protein